MDVRGKHVWLIGASEGIGTALAQQLAGAGAVLALSARNASALSALAQALPKATALPLDVGDAASVTATWETLTATWPAIDMVIYNAGTYEPLAASQYDLQKIERMIDVNLHGALRMLSHVLPYFLTRDAGAIVLVGSVAGYRGLPGALGYGLSKAALIHLAENLRADLARTHVTVHVVNPGFVKTRLTAKNDFPMPCMITPEAAAEAMMRGLQHDQFEIHFPKRFTRVLKLLRILPYWLYFRVLRRSL